ncbi:MAG: hypothetical protein ACRC8F_04225 [Cetobacterium sp.]
MYIKFLQQVTNSLVYSREGFFISTQGIVPKIFRPTNLIKIYGGAISSPFNSELSIEPNGIVSLQQTTGTFTFAHTAYYTEY